MIGYIMRTWRMWLQLGIEGAMEGKVGQGMLGLKYI